MTPSLNELDYRQGKLLFIIWGIIALLLIIAYWPGLHGPLIFDDIQNIVKNPSVAINDLSYDSLKQALLSNESGLLKRVLPALSFGINHYMAGGFVDTLPFKLTNLLIHIVNSGLLMCLLVLLWPLLKFPGQFSTIQIGLSVLLMTSLWALHPLQVSTVVYVVQRMTSMAATFVLLGLCVFIYGRQLLQHNFPRGMTFICIGVLGGTVLGLLSKENAALVSCYAAVIEFSLFTRKGLPSKQQWGLYFFYTVLVALPICLVLIYYFVTPGNLIASYGGRPFSLSERLWTESRVLWFYLSLLFIPDITNMGLFHDDIAVSHGWFQPVTTLVSVISWGVLLLIAFLVRNRLPVFTFAVLWFLVGHSMESSFLPLELVYEHRNYLPNIGIIVLIAYIFIYCFEYLFKNRQNSSVKRYASVTAVTLLIAGVAYGTFLRANYWASESSIFTSIGQNHPDSPISQYLYGEVLFKTEHKPLLAYPHYFKAAQLNTDEVAFVIMAILTTPPDIIANLSDKQLKKTLSSKHVVDLILHKPLSPWSLTIFEAAGKCVIVRQTHCLPHSREVSHWLQAVLKSRYIAKRYKRQYTKQLYTIQMLNGVYEPALKTIRLAITKYGRAFPYFMMQADALQALGRYKEALRVLHEAELGVRGRRPDLLRKVQHMQGIVAQQYRIQQRNSAD